MKKYSSVATTSRTRMATGLVAFVLWIWAGAALVNNVGDVHAQSKTTNGAALEVVVYASDLAESALYELDFKDEATSPGGKMIGLPNTGDELDPPPENDPNVKFKVKVQGGTPYRCWIHMKVGAPKGKSKANVFWAQFSDAVDKANTEILKPGSGSYMTAQGPEQLGWAWVKFALKESDAPIYFAKSGEVTVRLQAGMEGVGFDQFVLSPAKYLDKSPTDSIVKK